MKWIFTVILLAVFSNVSAQEESLMRDANTKPALSLRCKELFKERSAKIGVQQKLNALLQRNELLMKKSPNAKEGFRARLNNNQVKVKNELYLVNLQIEAMEENIIRSGCPGLSLE